MLKHMGLPLFASDIEKALNLVFREGKVNIIFCLQIIIIFKRFLLEMLEEMLQVKNLLMKSLKN